MSEMHSRYAALRAKGYVHSAAVDKLAQEIGVDRETVRRVLRLSGLKA